MPDSRRPSRAPSEDSTDTLRWMARTVQNRTATQNRPGAPLAIVWRSGPRAKAKSTSATIPNGATWDRATRERPSMRRSLPATSTASRHMGHRSVRGGDIVRGGDREEAAGTRSRRAVTRPPVTVTARPARSSTGPDSWLAISTVTPLAAASRTAWSSRSRADASRPAWGSSSSQSSGHRAVRTASATRRRCPADSLPAEVLARRPTSPHRSRAGSIRATSPPAARTAKRTFSRTVRSS